MTCQKTIKKEISLEGIGLHTGKKVKLKFKPAGTGEGIRFIRTDLKPPRTVRLGSFSSSHKRRTALSEGGVEVHTIEHLMASLWGLSIDNIIIEIDNIELPGLDGSAKDFFLCLKNAGIDNQEAPREIITIKNPIWCEKDNSFIGIFPGKGFNISYILESPSSSIGRQCLSLDLNEDSFYNEIAPARTFCLREEAQMLLRMGFGKGANTKNTLVMDKTGPIDNVLRFPDEPVRHKILDLVGDLYSTGKYIEGRVIGLRSGHYLNAKLVQRIMKEIIR